MYLIHEQIAHKYTKQDLHVSVKYCPIALEQGYLKDVRPFVNELFHFASQRHHQTTSAFGCHCPVCPERRRSQVWALENWSG